MTRTQRQLATIAIPIALALAAVLRLAWRDYVSADMSSALLGWYDYLALSPGIEALRARISTYSPPYLYILALSVHLREALWPELSPVMAVKLPSLLMDVGAAVAVGAAVRQVRSRIMAMLAGVSTLLSPTVWLNSGVWGQCDVFYATAVLVALIFGARKQYTRALFCFGIAAAFKAQALFAGPFVLYLLLQREIGLKALAAAAAGFVMSMLPAWWVGAPAWSTFLIYASQADEFMSLSLLAPNLYGLIPDTYLDYGTTVGLALTTVLCVLLSVFASALSPRVTPVTLIAVAAFAATLAPFTLPRMHERYFYLAELLLLVLAFYRPKLFWAPLLMQLASLNAYLEYFDLTTPGSLPPHVVSSTTGGWLVLVVLIGLAVAAVRARWPELTARSPVRSWSCRSAALCSPRPPFNSRTMQ
jgi:Gpi18-like mannosyltransferase